MIKIACTSCNKPLSIDETKLPMKQVSFPCPACKAKLTIDRRDYDRPGAAGDDVAPQPVTSPVSADDDDESDAFTRKALIVGADKPELRQAVRAVGYAPVHKASAAEGREYFVQEFPELVVLSPTAPSPPPIEEMIPMTSLTPGDRRKGFYMLVADNLRTLDGNAAFLYQVNVVIATKDLGSFARIYEDAYRYHVRLYQAMKVAAS